MIRERDDREKETDRHRIIKKEQQKKKILELSRVIHSFHCTHFRRIKATVVFISACAKFIPMQFLFRKYNAFSIQEWNWEQATRNDKRVLGKHLHPLFIYRLHVAVVVVVCLLACLLACFFVWLNDWFIDPFIDSLIIMCQNCSGITTMGLKKYLLNAFYLLDEA